MEDDPYALSEPTGSLWPHLLLWVVQLVAFASPNFRGRRPLFVVAIIATFVASQLDPHVYNDLQQAQPLSIAWANMLSSLEKIAFSYPSPEAALYRVDRPVGEATAMQPFGLAKLRWAIAILINMRGIRWNYQVKNVPPVKYGTRSQWLRKQLLNVVYYALMADLVNHLDRRLFYSLPDGSLGKKDPSLHHPDLRVSFLKALIFGATPYYMLSFQYTLMGVVAVVVGISKPEDWAAHFGSLSDAWTVREFWGNYWHQTLRKPLSAFSGALVDALGIKRGTNWSSYTQLWVSFLLSGLMHANGNRAMPRPAYMTTQDLMREWVTFFIWQAAAITVEDFVQWLWRKAGGRGGQDSLVPRIIGYAWVACNIWASLPLIGDSTLGLRMFEAPFFPISLAEPLMQYVPIP